MTTTDPRKAQGTITGPGGPYDRSGVIIDARNAVLVDHIQVAMVEPTTGGKPQPPRLAFSIGGRINRTTERSEVVYLTDVTGAAAICADIIGIMARAGIHDFADQLEKALEAQP